MKNNTLRIATRKSKLALWQANMIKERIEKQHPHITVSLKGIVTAGDQNQISPLTQLGGKSVFVKTLQQALLSDKADIAVHCIKDMSVHPSAGLTLGAICKREDPRDAFISNQTKALKSLRPGAIIGTASPRRTALIKSIRPDCEIKLLRGNVDTRLAKLDAEEYDAIILAAAGLHRLGLQNRIQSYLSTDTFTPAIGQGALAIECRATDTNTQELIRFLHHEPTAVCITAERAVNQVLDGDCHTPIGAYAEILADQIQLQAIVGSLDGATIIRSGNSQSLMQAKQLGQDVANLLLKQGAEKLIRQES